MDKNLKLIAVTGTKGKTTIVRLIDHILSGTMHRVLRVDSDGHYVDGIQKSTHTDSVALRQAAATVCPGKYLYELRDAKDCLAILEISVGSYARIGLGYLYHSIGILHNVYEDHIGVRVKDRNQLAQEKAELIFGALSPTEREDRVYAAYNMNDALVCANLDKINKCANATLLPYALASQETFFDYTQHINHGGMAILFHDDDKAIYVHTNNGQEKVLDVRTLPWAFDGAYDPINSALLATTAATLGYYQNDITQTKYALQKLKTYSIDVKGGRMALLHNTEKHFKCIVDYAHEKYSLQAVANFAKKLTEGNGKTIGIVRFAPDRTNEQLIDYAESISDIFDVLIIYDKIDGVNRKPLKDTRARWYRDIGEVSQIIYDAIVKKRGNKNIYRIILEEDALKHASHIVHEGDVIVHISNVHNRSMELITNILHCG